MFKGFGEQEIDIATIAGMDPIDDVPPVVANGVLTFKGHFATTPSPVNYALDFMVDNAPGASWASTSRSLPPYSRSEASGSLAAPDYPVVIRIASR